MVSHLRSARRWGRDVRLLYIFREGRGAYVDEIRSLTENASFFTDRAAFLAEVTATLATQPFGTHAYLCGPPQFIDDVVAVATGSAGPQAASTSNSSAGSWHPAIRSRSNCPPMEAFSPSNRVSHCWSR